MCTKHLWRSKVFRFSLLESNNEIIFQFRQLSKCLKELNLFNNFWSYLISNTCLLRVWAPGSDSPTQSLLVRNLAASGIFAMIGCSCQKLQPRAYRQTDTHTFFTAFAPLGIFLHTSCKFVLYSFHFVKDNFYHTWGIVWGNTQSQADPIFLNAGYGLNYSVNFFKVLSRLIFSL